MQNTIYKDVTDKIIEQMKEGRLPWVQPWISQGPSMPANATTGRAYSGINILQLWASGAAQGFKSNEWLTYKQAKTVDATVRKGEKGTRAFYADSFVPKDQKSLGDKAQSVFFLKSFTLFNVVQCDGIEPAEQPEISEPAKIDRAEAILANVGAAVSHGHPSACYIPSADVIHLPNHADFTDPVNYYRTAFHEHGHWTGHKSRLDRSYGKRFGDQAYAREELVAELCAAFTCATLRIVPSVRHADYIASWLEVLESDSKAIFTAASAASKAATYLLEAQKQKIAA